MVTVRINFRIGMPALVWVFLLTSCAVQPPEPRDTSAAHIGSSPPPVLAEIPQPVRRLPYLPPPTALPPAETYTVVVNDVPVKELLFALARDASVNVDIHPDISGQVTLNAIDQSLPQILDRISRQTGMTYEIQGNSLVVKPDLPYLKSYTVDYVNLQRDTSGTVKIETQVFSGVGGGSGEGDNSSSTVVTSESKNHFWATLRTTVRQILAATASLGVTRHVEEAVIINPENGILIANATSSEHKQIAAYLNQVLATSARQVLIEATVVEVELNDRYQAGVDWSRIAQEAGFTLSQGLLSAFSPAGAAAGAAGFFLQYRNDDLGERTLDLTIRLLKEFGDAKVLSSPKLMVINSQSALMKVVRNIVYFEIDRTPDVRNQDGSITQGTEESTAMTVPVGLIMSVTPQIDANDVITLSVRPTISRVFRFVEDPVTPGNQVPEIDTREMESVLKVNSGQIAVLGGLMQDEVTREKDGIPYLTDLESVGDAFSFRDNIFRKTELVIFLRPTVIRTPSVDADLADFRRYLPENLKNAKPVPTPLREYQP